MPEQAHEIVTEQAHGPIFEQAHGPMFEQAHGLETDQLEETREHVRAALYEKLLSLDPKQLREMLVNHVRRCTSPSCPTCCRIRERAAQRKQQRQNSEKRLRLWRGVAKSIGPMLALRPELPRPPMRQAAKGTMQLAIASRALSLISLRGTNDPAHAVLCQSIGPNFLLATRCPL